MPDNRTYEMDEDFQDIIQLEIEKVQKETSTCPFLAGEAGIGKSSVIEAMCEKYGWHFFKVACNLLGDRTDISGVRSVKVTETIKNKPEEVWKQVFFPHKDVKDAMLCAENNPDDIVILFLDEINRLSADITSAILSFTTDRKVGTERFPDNLKFITAGNDRGNITHLDEASMTRFAKFTVIPSLEKWLDHEGPNLNPYIKQVLTNKPNLLLCKPNNIVTSEVDGDDGNEYVNDYEVFDEGESMDLYTCPRTLSGLNALLNAAGKDKLTYWLQKISRDAVTGEETSLLEKIVVSHIGDTEFKNDLLAFIADDVSKGMLQKATNIVTPKKPKFWKGLMSCADRQTRDTMIDNMSDEEKSEAILYAVYEKGVDNSDIIQTIAGRFNNQVLSGDYQPQFSNLKSHDELDTDNYNALITSGTPLGTMMRNILGD